MIDHLFEATEMVLGDLSEPNKGILFAVPVVRAFGVLAPNDDSNNSEEKE